MNNDLSRRAFMKQSTVVAGGAGLVGGPAVANTTQQSSTVSPDDEADPVEKSVSFTQDLPLFCAHEHWGSIASIGMFDGGLRADIVQGATPTTPTNLLHLILDPYFGGWMHAAGVNPHRAIKERTGCADPIAEFRDRPVELWRVCLEVVADHRLLGGFQCTRRGIMRLYGIDPADASDDEIIALNTAIESNYADLFSWYERAMQQANFCNLVRPVHPEFFGQEESPATAAQERRFTQPILRIDPLLDLWKATSPRRDAMAAMLRIDPTDAASWRAFLDALFEMAKGLNNVGIKQLQAYSRPLAFEVRDDAAVKFRGDLTREEKVCFQDWVMHECCQRAHDLGWPHQVHVGTHNLDESGPLPLEALARRYPRQSLVLLHCWPFVEETGYLAKQRPNVYLDPCWQPILSPDFLAQSLGSWLRYVPANKLMISNDATSIEMAVGASLYAREALDQGLKAAAQHTALKEDDLRRMAAKILAGNAQALYAKA